MKLSTSIICGIAGLAVASAASALTTYSFNAVSSNAVSQVAAGESQLSMTVDQTVAGAVDFTFTDAGAISMTIANIYFSQDAALLSGISAIVNGTGVNFASGGSPSNLPSAPSGFSADFRTRAANPAPSNGVNPGETLTLRMGLAGVSTLADVLAALNANDDFLIGLHVISIDGAGSESFVSQYDTPNPPPPPVVPLPSAAGLGFAGLGVLGARRRRR